MWRGSRERGGKGEHGQRPWYTSVKVSIETHQVHSEYMPIKSMESCANASEPESAVIRLPFSPVSALSWGPLTQVIWMF